MAEGPDGATLLREAVAARGPVIDLAGAALACAAMDRGGLELAPYRAHLGVLARDVAAAAGALAPAAALAQATARATTISTTPISRG